ncbi:MAG: geranylgeranylglyceryl/heptaprenylglyceryl phosphate synthase [Desulfurococcales archaeon]|nr:geranylgeranylglyceryl/heptaprenylglyceryl phosphate synthase [Desulfurococcales archaeon]
MSILSALKKSKPVHLTLIDPGSSSIGEALRIAQVAYDAGTDAFLIGGSTNVINQNLDAIAEGIKKNTDKPVILFPGNINGLTSYADAVFYLILMNSVDPYYITGAHVQAAPILLRMKLEVIPTPYIIIGYGGTVGHIGKALPVPNDKPGLIASYALAGGFMGAGAIYLEAGSGAPFTVNLEGVKLSRMLLDEAGLDPLLIVGGGIKNESSARELIGSGADAIVTGTLAEEDPEKLKEIIRSIKE